MKHIFRSSHCLILAISISAVIAQPTPRVETTQLKENLFSLTCYNGVSHSKTFALTGKDGVVLIDAAYPQTSQMLKSAVDSLGCGPVKILINTHVHIDHMGANSLFKKEKALVIAHEQVRNRLMDYYGQILNIKEDSYPNLTFTDSLSLFYNGEEIKLLHFPGHSEGDVIVYLPGLDIILTGDLLITIGFPSVEVLVGGDIEQYISSLYAILNRFPENTRFFPSHGHAASHKDLEQFTSMVASTTETIREGLAEHKSVDDMRKEKILAEWDNFEPGGPTADYWIGAVAASLLNERKPSINEPLLQTINTEGTDAAIVQYRELKENSYEKYIFVENSLNGLGYYLLGNNRYEEAIRIFQLNVEEYPEAFNTYDSLGEAYMLNGENKPAIENYEKSLQLNPDNTNAEQMLRTLRGKQKSQD
jgi:cyclase